MSNNIRSEWYRRPDINPQTGRAIKAYGPTYLKLQKKYGDPLAVIPAPAGVYCGNNSRDPGLLDGTKVLGTRYQCLRKGIGKGLVEPIFEYSVDFEPIDQTKVFCGNGNVLPPNKDRFGSPSECLRKGFGVGRKTKYERDGGVQQDAVVLTDGDWYRIYVKRR
jgi:2-cysteine adaptor domain